MTGLRTAGRPSTGPAFPASAVRRYDKADTHSAAFTRPCASPVPALQSTPPAPAPLTPRPRRQRATPARTLRRRYVLALTAVAGLALGNHLLISKSIDHQLTDTSAIILAGRQRVFSQRVVYRALWGDAQGVTESRQKWRMAHDKLKNTLLDDPQHLGRVSRLNLIAAERERLLVAADAALATHGQPTPQVSDELRSQGHAFLDLMEDTVQSFEEFAVARLEGLQHSEVMLLGGTLLLLLIEVLFIFEPATRALRNQWQALARSAERMELAIRGSRDGLWDWDLAADRVYYSPRWRQLLGLKEQALSDAPHEWFNRVDADQVDDLQYRLTRLRAGHDPHLSIQLRMLHADGQSRWMLCRAAVSRNEQGHAMRLSGSLTDISELKAAQDELILLAHHDRLTGLPNRERFIKELQGALRRNRENPDDHFAVLFFDFDRFKTVNDSLGHPVGDALLINIAQRFRTELRHNDIAARFGGDEFVILLNGTTGADETRLAADRLLAALAIPHQLGKHSVVSTASIGVVTDGLGHTQAADVLRDADAAMYKAKAGGKNNHRFFDRQMHDAAVDRLRTENDLRTGLDTQLEVYYQPILTLADSRVVGFEALVRWNHPTRGLIAPDHFIPMAEETGLIVPLGARVLRVACQQLAAWDRGPSLGRQPGISVNCSKRQLLDPGFTDLVRDVLERSGLAPGRLTLEITETAVMENPDDIAEVMAQVRAMGVRLAMDDFGTGHSSLSCLHRFPINSVKMDRSFVRRMNRDASFAAVAQTIADLGLNLKLDIVAEGIEDPLQQERLRTMGCLYGQGYLFARPLTAEAATRYLQDGKTSANRAA